METTLAVLGLGALLFVVLGIASAILIATATLAGLLGAASSVLASHPAAARIRVPR